MPYLSARSIGVFLAGAAFGICICLARLASAQVNENAFKLFGDAATLSAPDTSEDLRRFYLAGVYDATANDALIVEFAKDSKKFLNGRINCFTTNARGKMATFSDWAYSKWSSTEYQTWSGAAVLGAACHAEGYY
jgi:hypothetical protein